MNRPLASMSVSALACGLLSLSPVTAMADPPAHARNENSAHYRGYEQHDRRDADDRWDDHDDYRRRYDDRRDRDDYRRYYDDRRDRDWYHYHPRLGHVVHRLPPGHRMVRYRGDRYYYGGGVWYRPFGASFVVVDPPLGLVVSFAPEFHATLHFGGVPYYRAGPVYYMWDPRLRGYVVTRRPYPRW